MHATAGIHHPQFTPPALGLFWAQPAVVTYRSDVLITSEEQKKTVFKWLSHRHTLYTLAPIRSSVAFMFFFLCISAAAFVLCCPDCQPESHQRSKKVTELHV